MSAGNWSREYPNHAERLAAMADTIKARSELRMEPWHTVWQGCKATEVPLALLPK